MPSTSHSGKRSGGILPWLVAEFKSNCQTPKSGGVGLPKFFRAPGLEMEHQHLVFTLLGLSLLCSYQSLSERPCLHHWIIWSILLKKEKNRGWQLKFEVWEEILDLSNRTKYNDLIRCQRVGDYGLEVVCCVSYCQGVVMTVNAVTLAWPGITKQTNFWEWHFRERIPRLN